MTNDSRGELVAWVRSVSDLPISFTPPAPGPAHEAGVSLYLLEMHGSLPLSPARPDRRQLELGYLVTAWASDSSKAQQLLVDLCFAAMEQPGMEVELDPVDVRVWQAFGVPPQPSFRVNVPLRRGRPEPEVKPVLKPLMVEPTALATIWGAVRTPEDSAVPEARVEVPRLGRATTTDRHGLFRLDGIPTGPRPVQIRVRARGREVTRDVGPREDRSFLVITINPTEAVHG
jgi:hypothetical protein